MTDLRRAMALLELDRRRVLISIATGTATLGSALLLAGLSAWLIIRAWQMPPVLDLTVAVVAVRALGISRGLFRYLERLATHDTALRGTTAARTQVYRRLAAGDPAATAGLTRGDLLTRTGADVDALGDVVVRALIPMSVAALLSVAAVITVGVIAPAAGLVLAIALVIAGVVAPWLGARAATDAESDGDDARARFTENAVTAVDHAAELRVAGQLGAPISRAGEANLTALRATDRAAVPAAWADAAAPLAMGASLLGALLIGLTVFGSGPGTMSPTMLGVLVLLPLSAFEATAPLPAAALALLRAQLSARRVNDLLDRADEPVAHGGAEIDGPGVLRAVGLQGGWPGRPVTEPIDADLAPGARVVIVGGSGSGKTTLLMTLAGLLPPRAGTVTLDGRALDRYAPDAVRRTVSFFAEDAHLFDTSVLENLRVARGDVDEAEARAALEAVGLGRWVSGLPDGVHTTLAAGAHTVSGGQRRRILLARALVSPARILLLDEPAEHLDDADAADLQRRLLDRGSGLVAPDRTVVVVTHRQPEGVAPDVRIRVAARPHPSPGTSRPPVSAFRKQ